MLLTVMVRRMLVGCRAVVLIALRLELVLGGERHGCIRESGVCYFWLHRIVANRRP